MNFFKEIKSIIKNYKAYKNSENSKALTLQNNSRKRNLFSYIQALNLGRKHRDTLYRHFKIMDDIYSYELIINLFGKKNIDMALADKEATTEKIAAKLLDTNTIENFNSEMQSNYVLKTIMQCIIFNKTTGLELSEIDLGINPQNFKRESLNNKSMLEILNENQVSKKILEEIYNMYGKEIISCYNNDSYLRNETVLKLDGKYKETIAVGGLQDHVTYYSEDDFNLIFKKYFDNGVLSKTEKCILVGLLAKESDLIGMYTLKQLRENNEYIKSEINIGIFNDILFERKKYTYEERKRIVELSKVWNEDDLNRYNNLALLRQRLASLPQDQNISDIIHNINEIESKTLDEIISKSEEISKFMDLAFTDYEIQNRNQIIEKVYSPEKGQEVIITDLKQIGSAAMLHFFTPNRTMLTFNKYVTDLEEKRSMELGTDFEFSEQEKEAMLLQYEAKENHYITDYHLNFEGIGQVGSFDTRYVTNTSNQLCTMVTTPKEILEGQGIRGQIALGFSKSTLSPELIATISDRNIHSNKGIDYIETNNSFKDFSVSYDELVSQNKKCGDNTELVLFRNSYQDSLKPSYIMYIGNNKLDSEIERKNIEAIKEQMKKSNLAIPLVIFDRYAIKENIKDNSLITKQDYGDRER